MKKIEKLKIEMLDCTRLLIAPISAVPALIAALYLDFSPAPIPIIAAILFTPMTLALVAFPLQFICILFDLEQD
jgi:hypothetical protein